MYYLGHDIKTLIVYPQAARAILDRRAALGLPVVPIKELEYGIDEVMRLVNRLDAELLAGKEATILGLLDKLAEGWDIVWLITHCDSEGWYLTDGIVNVSETTQLIRSAGTFLTVMNTCSSVDVAEQAALELGTAFICTISEVPDRQAFITGVIFANKLAAGLDYVEAFKQARPGQDATYRLIEARIPMAPPEIPRNDRQQRNQDNYPEHENLARFIASVKDLEIIVYGSPRMGIPPLKDVTRNIETELRGIKDDLADIKDKQRFRTWFIWGMALLNGLLLGIVAILVFMAGA